MTYLLERLEALDPQRVMKALPRISPQRAERLKGYRRESDQMRSILAELLLRYALKTEFGCDDLPVVAVTEYGKPYFPERPELCFSLSHCKTAVACALDEEPLGVDVQEQRAFHTGLYRVLSEPEREWMEWDPDRRFTVLWTLKEAYGKAIGRGIRYELEKTEFLPRQTPWRQYGFWFTMIEREDTCLSVCAKHKTELRLIRPEQLEL